MKAHSTLDSRSTWLPLIMDSRREAEGLVPPFVVGVLEGEGVGPEVIETSLDVLAAIEASTDHRFEIRRARDRGIDVQDGYITPLNPLTRQLCQDIFNDGGAILAGPGGGRFVYDLRREFDLFCKLVPVVPFPQLARAGRLRAEYLGGVDVLIIRENVSGIYFSETREELDPEHGRRLVTTFSYSEREVRRILSVAANIAAQRRKKLTVVTKEGGLPGMSGLWRDCALDIASREGVSLEILLVDYAAYFLIQHPHQLDVVVAPNLFGDILADVSATLMGSRGLSFSGNFSGAGAGVYQTNHGAAKDLVNTNQANPIAQILSLAMMLRHSFELGDAALLIESAIAAVLHDGWRTQDIMEQGCRIVGTREMGQRIAGAVQERAELQAPR